jgi:hypothetical protein
MQAADVLTDATYLMYQYARPLVHHPPPAGIPGVFSFRAFNLKRKFINVQCGDIHARKRTKTPTTFLSR